VRLTYAFVLGLWVISAFAALNVDSERDFELSWLLCLIGHGALICAFIPAFLANLFAKENELANVDMLLMTSMTPEEIAKGKMYAAIRRVGTFLIGSIAANSIMLRLAYAWDQSIPLVVAGQFTLCLCAALVLVATMWASILSKRTAPAIIASFVFSALSLCGVLILFAVVFATLGINFPPDPWAYLSPVFAYIEVFDDRTRRQGPIPEGWFACMAIHALAVCGLYIRAIRYYAARVSTKRSLELPV
jgi:ABC-type transport system involved in multi-copper enzyme maturation permease subunit